MIYKLIHITNFKGIKDVEIDFTHNRIITLVGLNESGKTTILEAINLFYGLIKDRTLTSKELNDIRPKGIDFTGNISVRGDLKFEDSDIENLNHYLTKNSKRTKVIFPKEFSLTFNFKYDLHEYKTTEAVCDFTAKAENAIKDELSKTNNGLWQELIRYVESSLIPEILYYEDFIFEIPERISFDIDKVDEDEEQSINVNKEWKLVFDDILKTVSPKFNSFQNNVVNIWKSDNDTARQRLAAMEKQLDNKITNAWKELFAENEKKGNRRLNFKEIKLIPITDSTTQIAFSFKVKTESGKEFSLNERSKGCKWFFSFLIFTEFRKNRTKNIMFLLDEPASNLHSSAQLKILDAISSLSDKSVIAYSTHSHHLINPIWLNGAYVVVNEGVSISNLEGALTDNDDAKITVDKYFNYVNKKNQNFQSLYFQPILDRLDYKPSFIDPVPFVCICEGKNDWYTFKYFDEIIFKNKKKTNFYPGKGAGSNEDIIRLYLSWGSKFILILDGDKSGKTAKKKYIKEFGKILEDKVFTLEDILEKSCFTEQLFSEEDYQLIIDKAFGQEDKKRNALSKQFNKSSFNFALSQLLSNRQEVKLQDQTLENFTNIFTFISNNLK